MVSVPPPLFLPKLAMIAKPSAERVADTYVQEFLFAVDRRNYRYAADQKFGMAMSTYQA